MINLGTVNITDETKALMIKALNDGIISGGKYVAAFEENFAKWLGVKHAIAVSSGTMADACALAAIRNYDGGKRNEIIVPALTFVAQINAIWCNHLKPVFIDVNKDFNIDVERIEEKITDKTLAIMPTHLLGRPARMREIEDLAIRYSLFIVEDACEALGSTYYGSNVGAIRDVGCFSFFVSHSITTGEGGMVATNNGEIAGLVRSLRNHGRKSDHYHEKFLFPHIGFSAKMNAMEAIIGLGIMPMLDSCITRRRDNGLFLNNLMKKSWMREKNHEYIVPHAYPIMAKSHEERQKLLIDLPQKYGIEARQIFYSIPTQCEAYAFLGEKPGSYPVAEDIGLRGLYVPCHQNLSREELEYTARILNELV
ncbi:DegT/DnrJ/EryC1/StrS family aminotransferase [Candidatus Azambacteria bacterium]|nr:DegT/DnrJ/EryC1/StrS family aminotransferase [Candidatus Azambacteria bacterium]